jgi:undecaprenyl-diphosphatase
VAVYGASETLKVLEEQSRPCQALAVEVIAACPPARDWSLPSNHATIAGALAAAVVALWPRGAVAAVPLALLVAASRVALGVHYPHDALTGLALGGAGVALVAWTAPARLRKVRAPAAA